MAKLLPFLFLTPFLFGQKIKGLSCVAPPKVVQQPAFDKMKKINADWVALMPYSFYDDSESKWRFQWESNGPKWWGEGTEGISSCAQMAHKTGLKVMLKPHIWLNRGQFTGTFKPKSYTDFENGYKTYLLHFAQIAQKEKIEMLCIGNELAIFVAERPQFWLNLISEIRKIYTGKIIYGENWDTFEKVPFWGYLDAIGVNGYFPLSDKSFPSVTELNKAWKKHKNKLEKLAIKHQKPLIFTEVGYRSVVKACEKPWESANRAYESQDVQAAAYESLFQSLWHQKWFGGVFIWKWFPEHETDKSRDQYSPQGKSAEKVLQNYFAK